MVSADVESLRWNLWLAEEIGFSKPPVEVQDRDGSLMFASEQPV